MPREKKNLIYLTGFMGSGKSTIAPILANTLGYSFVDIDQEIEKVSQKKVNDIFFEDGEDYFRNIERSLLERVSRQQGCVISLGGGTIAIDENLRIVKSSGILVYLKTDPDRIFQRLEHKDDRPLLKSKDGRRLSDDKLRQRISQLLALREPFYNQADVTVSTDETKVGYTVDEIVRCLKPLIT